MQNVIKPYSYIMNRLTIKQTGIKWATGNGCELYVVKTDSHYQWWMFGKTGTHMIANNGLYGQHYACERILNHWKGFKANQ